MTSSRIVSACARRNIHYGWVVVAVTFLVLLVTAGAMGTPGVMIVPLENEFGWSDAQISSVLALRILLFGLFGPFAAALMNRFGVRRVIVSALALIAAGLLISLMMTQVWQLVLLWGVVVGIGSGLTAMVLAATVATRWFNHRRGLVLGMLAASSATGQLLFLPVIAELTTYFGWRIALVLVSAALGAIGVVVLFLMRDRPSDIDLPVYGETVVIPPLMNGAGLASLLLSPLITLRDCARVPIFWVLFGTFFVCGCSTNGLIQTHFVALCHDYGLAATAAASVLAMMGAFDFIGTIGTEQTSPRACTVKAPHIASLTTKAYFRKCQIRFRLTESQPNELASPHSITSSALARSDGGTVSPRALAAVKADRQKLASVISRADKKIVSSN